VHRSPLSSDGGLLYRHRVERVAAGNR
jgi:hypothetical protein